MHVARLIWLSGLATLPRMQHLREHDARDKCTSHHSGPHRDLACCIMHDTVICSAWVADFLCFSGAKEANVEELMTEPDFMLDLPSFTDICDLDIIGPEDRIRANQAKSGQVVEKKSAEDFATKTICSGMLQGKMLSLKIVTSWPLVMINDRKTGGGLAFLGFLSTAHGVASMLRRSRQWRHWCLSCYPLVFPCQASTESIVPWQTATDLPAT